MRACSKPAIFLQMGLSLIALEMMTMSRYCRIDSARQVIVSKHRFARPLVALNETVNLSSNSRSQRPSSKYRFSMI